MQGILHTIVTHIHRERYDKEILVSGGRHSRDRMIVGVITTYAICTYHH